MSTSLKPTTNEPPASTPINPVRLRRHSRASSNPTQLTKPLPSHRIAIDNQLEMLRAYGVAGGSANRPVSVQEVADIVKIAPTSFYLVNPFFSDIGLIRKVEQTGQSAKYYASEEVRSFVRAFEWNRETAAHKLAPLIGASWFAAALLSKLAFDQLEETAAIRTLAEKASAGPEHEPRLRFLLGYLEVAGLARRENGIIKAVKQVSPREEVSVIGNGTNSGLKPANPLADTFTPGQGINFQIGLTLSVAEIASLSSEQIVSLFGGIAQVLAAKGSLEKEASRSGNI